MKSLLSLCRFLPSLMAASLLVRADDGMRLYNAFPKEKARIN